MKKDFNVTKVTLGIPNPMGIPNSMGLPNPMGIPNSMGLPNPMGSPTLMGSPNPMGIPNPMGLPLGLSDLLVWEMAQKCRLICPGVWLTELGDKYDVQKWE
jgi:hypothetical protein